MAVEGREVGPQACKEEYLDIDILDVEVDSWDSQNTEQNSVGETICPGRVSDEIATQRSDSWP